VKVNPETCVSDQFSLHCVPDLNLKAQSHG
jgi:hypothetical protein